MSITEETPVIANCTYQAMLAVYASSFLVHPWTEDVKACFIISFLIDIKFF
jgi:hypothetical protein